jgi:hypothetical protein
MQIYKIPFKQGRANGGGGGVRCTGVPDCGGPGLSRQTCTWNYYETYGGGI